MASCISTTGARTWCTASFHKGVCRQKWRDQQAKPSPGTCRCRLQITRGVVHTNAGGAIARAESKKLGSDCGPFGVRGWLTLRGGRVGAVLVERGKLWKLPRIWKSGKTNSMFSHFPTSAWKTRRKNRSEFPTVPTASTTSFISSEEEEQM